MTLTPAPSITEPVVPGLDRPAPESYAERVSKLAEQPLGRAGRPQGLFSGTAHSIKDIWAYRGLLSLLVRRELKARYKDSTLGFVWSLLRPLALLAVYYVAIGKFLQASKSTPDYAVYIYSGITIWSLFSEILSAGTGSIIANGGLVKKIYLPREVFPLSAIGSALFNFMIQVFILLTVTFIVGKPPGLDRLGYFALATVLVLVIGTALAFLLSALNVYLRDIQYLVEITLMFAMWTAPVVYQWHYVRQEVGGGRAMTLYQCNPLTLAVEAFQQAFWVRGDSVVWTDGLPGHPSHLITYILVEIVVGIFLLWGCQRVFARLQDNFAQEL
jgi:ABC-2 type transport system permease protein